MTEANNTEKTHKIRFAILGYGYIGRRHAECVSQNPLCELAAVCDSDPSKLKGFNLQAGVFDDLNKLLLEGPDFDVLSICTPNGLHAEHAMAGLEKGKHVVIEKPMALKSEDCKKLIDLSLKKDLHVFCVMQNRYSPPAEWLKDIVDKEILGKIFMVNIDCFWNRDNRYYDGHPWKGNKQLDGGTLFTQFSHFVDVMYWLFGEIEGIQAVFDNFNHKDQIGFEDTGSFNFRFSESGAIGNFNYSSSVWDKNMESSLTVIAENGTIKIGGQYMNHVEYVHVKDYQMPILRASAPPNNYGQFQGSASNHAQFYDNVVAAISGHEKITTNAFDGMKVVEIIEKVYEKNNWIKNGK